ncbi:hypothetical protein WN48_04058 [Eufriesea mexicana]|uniref:Uncharacterized protein n=1 Tax=Eufriesea mexicana TaxID=516756 RepID=A0A310S6I4_9HYME|nr:PREDICTED: uncharacterized protein LOC108554490 [Eufriesea mexicana]OAD51896.1 hypothetical protein WN48_04058 [Eufriesea mexicana]
MDLNKSKCSKCAAEKEDYKQLSQQQKTVYEDISKFLKAKKNGVIVIDTLSGTGKTFLLSTLARSYSRSAKFVIFRKDQASRISLNNIDTYTYISFVMHYFSLTYKHAIRMFRTNSLDNVAELYNLIVYSKKFVDNTSKIIVLDIYTIPPPSLLILLYIVSLKNQLHLIFAGSSVQLETIHKSPFHDESNFFIIQIMGDLIINNKLPKSIRICDSVLEYKMSRFSQILKQYKTAGNVPFHYNIRYALYCLFRSKYFVEERFDTIYIAQTHKIIKNRMHRFIQYLKSNGKRYVESPFYYVDKHGVNMPISITHSGKFLPNLLLVEGYKYIHINKRGIHNVVHLEKIVYENNEVCSLKIRFVTDNRVENILRDKLNYYQILPAYRTWLLTNIVHTDELWQFPLRPYTLTYHAALGQTINQEEVEFDTTNCHQANFIYVGLCCVRHYSDIYKIHDTRDLLSYVVTDYMENVRNDKRYYYRCSSIEVNENKIFEYITNNGLNKYIDSIEWRDVPDIKQFEKMPMYCLRIERSLYEHLNKSIDTPLMKVTRFIKENPSVILHTIKMAPVGDFNVCDHNKDIVYVKNKKKKTKEREKRKESSAFDYLKNEYNRWLGETENV